ncbi:hypothetical protein C463_08304 [Halorubrum californiense DSM 19288]|uniref:Uncharacterized protein n=1 Tax=Halorubrum californiense DSM 19288 TaxID=1227465 RepID=M0ECH5_9EURY|nr:hypothetical protein C463_08304 [Halorubrum californiense DSM 19288]
MLSGRLQFLKHLLEFCSRSHAIFDQLASRKLAHAVNISQIRFCHDSDFISAIVVLWVVGRLSYQRNC